MKNHQRRNSKNKKRIFEDGEKHKNEEWSVTNMLKSFFNILSDTMSTEEKQNVVMTSTNKENSKMGRKALTRTQKFLNALLRGEAISWKEAQSKFEFKSPRTVVDGLRRKGYMVYINKTNKGTSYKIGTPTKEIIAAGLAATNNLVYTS